MPTSVAVCAQEQQDPPVAVVRVMPLRSEVPVQTGEHMQSQAEVQVTCTEAALQAAASLAEACQAAPVAEQNCSPKLYKQRLLDKQQVTCSKVVCCLRQST